MSPRGTSVLPERDATVGVGHGASRRQNEGCASPPLSRRSERLGHPTETVEMDDLRSSGRALPTRLLRQGEQQSAEPAPGLSRLVHGGS